MENFLSTLAATLIGVAATWFFGWWYYLRAGDELQRAARELRRLTTLILTRLRDAGVIRANVTQDGQVADFSVTLPTRGLVSLATLEIPTPPASDPPPVTLESRSALSRAKLFLDKAQVTPADHRVEFEAFLEAAIIYARTAVHRFKSLHEKHAKWKPWWDGLGSDPAVNFFRVERDWILKEASPKIHQKVFAARSARMAGMVQRTTRPRLPSITTTKIRRRQHQSLSPSILTRLLNFSGRLSVVSPEPRHVESYRRLAGR
jgi:hypothetical protein